jgi:hypothetical protein
MRQRPGHGLPRPHAAKPNSNPALTQWFQSACRTSRNRRVCFSTQRVPLGRWNTAFRLTTFCARERRQFSAPAAAGAQRSLGPACSRAKAVPEDRRPAPRSRFRGPGRFWGYGAAERGSVKVGRSSRGESEAASLADSLTAESKSDATDRGFGRLSWADSGNSKTAPTTF